MTKINIILATPSPDGRPVPAEGSAVFEPSRRRTVVSPGPDVTLLPRPFELPIDPSGRLEVYLAPSGIDWCWEIRFAVKGMKRWIDYVAVPDVEEIDYTDLVRIDPKTLEPDEGPTAIWYGYVGGAVDSAAEARAAESAALEAAIRAQQYAELSAAASEVVDPDTGRIRDELLPPGLSEAQIDSAIDERLAVIDGGNP